jgi:hypothetical protein
VRDGSSENSPYWSVVEIDPGLNDAEVLSEDFSNLMLSQLIAAKGCVD